MTKSLALIVVLILCSISHATAQTPAPATRTTTIAPDLSFRPLSGPNQIRMSAYENQTVVIVLWASWCPPCRLALTELMAIERDSSAKTPFPIVALSIEDPTTAEADLRKAIDIINFKGVAGWIDENAPLVEGRKSVPQVLIVKNLKVLKRYIGWHPKNTAEIRKLLTTATKPGR
jgi:thiol-disulfide isomerase/thioredoxin